MTVRDVDIAITGGGPAGSAAALTLLRYSKLRVAVIEKGDYSQWRAGETLSPAVRPLLDYLDASPALESDGQLRNYGTAASWGSPDVVSRDFLFVGAGEGWHLDRCRFDRALAMLVRERGGTLHTNSTLTADELNARFIIDASGRHASVGRSRGAVIRQHDNLTGLVALFAGETEMNGALVEAAPDGWWYSVQVPGDRIVVSFMTDADIVRDRRLHVAGIWCEALQETNATRRRLANATLLRPPAPFPAQSQILEPLHGGDWIAAGDAAVAFDPLSSMGIGYAIASGIQAARFAAAAVEGNNLQLDLYAEDVAGHFTSYLAQRGAYYDLERRWQDRPFWKRRHSLPNEGNISGLQLAQSAS
jgi:flavin-dependent dehydrogenase